MEGGHNDGDGEGGGKGEVRGGSRLPVAQEGICEGREAHEEKPQQREGGTEEDHDERPPVVAGVPLPGLVLRQFVQREDGPEQEEGGEEDHVRQRVQQGEEGVGVVGHGHLCGDVVDDLGQAGSDEQPVVNGDVEIVDTEPHHEPDQAQQHQRGEEAFHVEINPVETLRLPHHRQPAGHRQVGPQQLRALSAGQPDLEDVAGVGEDEELEERVESAVVGLTVGRALGAGEAPLRPHQPGSVMPGGGGETLPALPALPALLPLLQSPQQPHWGVVQAGRQQQVRGGEREVLVENVEGEGEAADQSPAPAAQHLLLPLPLRQTREGEAQPDILQSDDVSGVPGWADTFLLLLQLLRTPGERQVETLLIAP